MLGLTGNLFILLVCFFMVFLILHVRSRLIFVNAKKCYVKIKYKKKEPFSLRNINS